MLANPEPLVVTGTLLRTSGAAQVAVADCPNCSAAHRHLAVGLRTAPCGATYIVRIPEARTGLSVAA
ncbi:hypothetical protein [Streptomyces sp. RPT161]|uniref:hypothetical protein n=1 Tax=Streptomyces sp. RPT161 TaxID=3015993 RepID=UPI0022B89479|nr:hypothetical protein [Streptomyces sp. RPT161]